MSHLKDGRCSKIFKTNSYVLVEAKYIPVEVIGVIICYIRNILVTNTKKTHTHKYILKKMITRASELQT